MNIPDITQLILKSSIWFLIGLVIYYLLSFIKVHLIWKIQSRIWNVTFENAIFKGYKTHLLKSFFGNFRLHKATLKYVFKYREKDFLIDQNTKTDSIKNRLKILDNLTSFLKPFLFFALIFTFLKLWISSRFSHNELSITLGEIQILLNELKSLPIINTLNEHKVLIYILLGFVLIFIPYFYTRKNLGQLVKRRLKLFLISLTILTNITFFGVLTSDATSNKTSKLLALKVEISSIHDTIFKEVYVSSIINEIEDELINEEHSYVKEIERFNNKIQSVANYPKDETLRKELSVSLLSKLNEIVQLSFKINDFKYNKTYSKHSKKRHSEFNDYHKKNHNSKSSYKNYGDYMGDEKKWTKSKGKSIFEDVKIVTKKDKKPNLKLRKVLELLFDQGASVLTSTLFNELDLSSQKTLKKIVNIGIGETFKNRMIKKAIDVLNAIPNISKAKEILITKNNLYTVSKKEFSALKKNNDAFFQNEISKIKKKQYQIDKQKAIIKLDRKISEIINSTINSFDDANSNIYSDYKTQIFRKYKSDLKVNELPLRQINQLIVSTSIITNKVKSYFKISRSSNIRHPFPSPYSCPICLFNLK